MRKKYKLTDDGMLLFKNRKYVHDVVDLRRLFMDEFHKIPYSSHNVYQIW